MVDVERGWSVLTVLFPVAEHNVYRGAEPPNASFDAADQLSGLKESHQLVNIAALTFRGPNPTHFPAMLAVHESGREAEL